ncbi:MAG: hypothetical protein WDW36_008373 [Sanguina aurantia]
MLLHHTSQLQTVASSVLTQQLQDAHVVTSEHAQQHRQRKQQLQRRQQLQWNHQQQQQQQQEQQSHTDNGQV